MGFPPFVLACHSDAFHFPQSCLVAPSTMTWKQCSICHWWRRTDRPGSGCGCGRSLASSNRPPAPSKPTPPATRLPTGEDMAHRWQMAKTSASNPNHVRIEKICSACHSRSFASKTSCRICGSSLEGAYTLLPKQWPPLGVPPQVLALYDKASSHSSGPATEPPQPSVPPVTVASAAPSGPPTAQTGSLSGLTTSQLKAETAKLDKMLSDTLVAPEGSAIHQAVSQKLADIKTELSSRRPQGQQLDQALARERAAKQAREAAQRHVCGLGKVPGNCSSDLGTGCPCRGNNPGRNCQDQGLACRNRDGVYTASCLSACRSHLGHLGHPAPSGHSPGSCPCIDSCAWWPLPATSPSFACTHRSIFPRNSIPSWLLRTMPPCPQFGRRAKRVTLHSARSRSGTPRGRRAPSTSSRGTSHTARTARTQLDTPSTTQPASLAPAT